MLLQTDTTIKGRSIYKCDRCNTILERGKDAIYSIFVKSSKDKAPKKKWDLCKRDYLSLCRGIEKSKINRKENNNGI